MHRIEKKTEKRMKENCGKIENILNLALDATREEREKSLNLDVGYDVADDSWEVIVKFFGTTEELRQKLSERFPEEQAQIGIYNLTNEYAILRIPQPLVELVASMPEIEYMEKPKRLFFSVENGKRSSCINPLQTGQGTSPTSNLTGKEVLVAVIDSGIDYAHPDFCNSDGTTRIAVLWDQTLDTVYERETINLALRQESEQEQYAICPSRDASGHGTHVAGIAAGNGRASNGRYRGVAYESELIVVKLGVPRETSFPKTTELMSAVDFCIARARQYGKPIALNLSFGNNYGSHSGNSLIETYLDDMANYWKTSIVIGSGNEGSAAVGQAELMHIYQNFFGEYSQRVAQILLTKDDFKEGERKTNTTNTLETLLNFGVIPIVNANDTISTFEIEFSDNDRLSASVASLIGADLLVILTDIDALYDSNPKTHPDAKRISYVEKVTDDIMKMGGEKGSEFSVGGMETKLLAARECYDGRVIMGILDGSEPLLIEKLISGEDVGTIFDCMED